MEYFVVELMAEQHHRQVSAENEFTLPVPIVDGPYDDAGEAHRAANEGGYGQSIDGYAAVSVPKGEVPEDWYEE